MNSAMFSDLDEFLSRLAEELSDARSSKKINDDFLATTKFGGDTMSRSSIGWLIISTGLDLDYMYDSESGITLKDTQIQFSPGLQFWDGNDQLVFAISHRGTDTSDSRIIDNDLLLYRASLGNDLDNKYPKYWLIIYTLPDTSVRDWESCDYDKGDIQYEKMCANPHLFYKNGFINPKLLGKPKRNPDIAGYPSIVDLFNSPEWNDRKLFLINLTSDGLEIDFPQQFTQKYHI